MSKAVWQQIYIYFLAFLPCVTRSPVVANGLARLGVTQGFDLHIYYIYFGVGPPQLAVTGPHGQLVSIVCLVCEKNH